MTFLFFIFYEFTVLQQPRRRRPSNVFRRFVRR